MILDSAKNCIIHILLIGSVQFALGFFFIIKFFVVSSEQATRRLLPETKKAS
jgi:hypothetical protein